jgi:GT2 family glycosyltransferase
MTTITVVTPWLRHPELADDYVEAMTTEPREGDDVIIVDNGDAPELPFRYARPTRNLGFVRASNLGLLLAKTDAVLFLNNDIALKRVGWLQEIREALEPDVLVGPLRNDPHAWVDGQPMPYLDGWCLAGMTGDLVSLGGFDETLAEPAYYSDNLLCLEARAAGMTLRDIRPGLTHKLNVTAGRASTRAVRAASAANRVRYIARARELLVAA